MPAGVASRVALGLAVHYPGLTAVPAVEIQGAVAVEHDVCAGCHLEVIEPRLQRDGRVGSSGMSPDHAAGIANESAQLRHGEVIGVIELPPGHPPVPGRDGALDGGLVREDVRRRRPGEADASELAGGVVRSMAVLVGGGSEADAVGDRSLGGDRDGAGRGVGVRLIGHGGPPGVPRPADGPHDLGRALPDRYGIGNPAVIVGLLCEVAGTTYRARAPQVLQKLFLQGASGLDKECAIDGLV